MAGSWEGMVKAKDGSYVPVSLGYMWDDDGDDGLSPGYFGILFLGHTTDPTGNTAPMRVRMRSFQSFSGQQPFAQGGDPTSDSERYILLSTDGKDQNTAVGKQNDFRFMVSNGPFKVIEPDGMLNFQAGMVVGNGLQGLLNNAAEAALTYYGNYFNNDGNILTGVNGRETQICQEDFAATVGGENPIFTFVADLIDTSCVTQEYVLSKPRINNNDLTLITDLNSPNYGKHCLYVNMDNCFECSRQNGNLCAKDRPDLLANWNCWDATVSDDDKAGCTGIGGNEHNIRWLVGMAPPPPGMRLWPTDNAVHVYWDNRSEVTKDIRLNTVDFESYRIWRADNWERPFGASVENGPESTLWQLIAEYDLVDFYVSTRTVTGGTVTDTLPLGANTGLELVRYLPICLADTAFGEQFHGLPQEMQAVVDLDSLNAYQTRPALRDREGLPVEGLTGLLPWEGYPAQLDTFFMATYRAPAVGVKEKRASEFYEYLDQDVHNGFLYFYSVTATDRELMFPAGGGDPYNAGAGQSGDPGSSFDNSVPGAPAQTAEQRERQGANIYVYPNPANRENLAEFQQMYPNGDDPTGVRVVFANLPAARNTIKIFTEDGDLVQTIEHDGTSGYGQVSWNLVSRNGQEIVSGIYLYAVQSDDDRFDDFIGKFVVIR